MKIDQIEYVTLGLYLAVMVEIMWLFITNSILLEFYVLLAVSILLLIRTLYDVFNEQISLFFKKLNEIYSRTRNASKMDLTPWHKFRYFLYTLLEVQKILPPSKQDISKELQNEIQAEIQELRPILIPPEQEFIQIIRSIGVDGILILIYLMKRAPYHCNAKLIQKDLKIPIATVYRILEKLENHSFIDKSFNFSQPNTALYQILSEGESIVVQLFDMIGGNNNKYYRIGNTS